MSLWFWFVSHFLLCWLVNLPWFHISVIHRSDMIRYWIDRKKWHYKCTTNFAAVRQGTSKKYEINKGKNLFETNKNVTYFRLVENSVSLYERTKSTSFTFIFIVIIIEFFFLRLFVYFVLLYILKLISANNEVKTIFSAHFCSLFSVPVLFHSADKLSKKSLDNIKYSLGLHIARIIWRRRQYGELHLMHKHTIWSINLS